MLRNKRVYIFIAVFLFFCGGVWIYVQHQNAAFKSNTYSYISAVNSLKSKQISDWYVDKINNAKLMTRNPYIQTFVSQYLAEKNYSKLKKLLSIIAEEHDIVSIFFIDSSFSFESKRITNLQFNYDIKYETIPEQTVHVSDLYYNTDSLIVVDFVAPLFSKSHERLGFLVFQNSVSKTINKTLAQKILTDVSRNTFTNVLFQTDSSLAHYNYAIHKIKQYSQDSFFMSYSVLDSVKKNNLYTGQVSQKNSLFKKQDLFVVHNVKHTNLYIYTVLPADEFYAQQIQSQIYIAIFFTIILLLFVFLFLLKKSNKKQSMYKKMYMLQAQYKTMLYSMGDAVIVTNELGIVQNVNGIAEELIGCTEAKAKHKYIDDLFTVAQEKNNSTHSEVIQHVLTTGKKHTIYHAQLQTNQQKIIPINESIAPIRDNNSVITGLVFVIHNQTKERQILQELEESNRKLESLFSNLPGMFYHGTYDEKWHMTFVSSGVTELTGYTPFDFISKSIAYGSITHKDDSEHVSKVIKTAIKNKESFLLEYRIVCKNETIKWVWERGNGVFDKHGNIIAIEGYIEDISERKQTELALLESEEIYRKQFEDHTAIQFLVEPMSGDIINVNKAAVDYYGWDKAQFLKMKITEVDTLSYDKIVEKVVEAQDKNLTFFDFQHRKADGTIRDVEVYSSPIEIKGTVYTHSIVHDVTDKKEALKQIILQSKAIEQSPVSTIITNNDGYIEYVNTKFCEISGYTIDEVIGTKPSFFKIETQSEAFYKNIWETVTSGNDWEGEFQTVKKTGELYWEKGLITPIINAEGEITHFVAINEDVTEKKLLLEDLVSAKEKAEESDRLKSVFLANISHEIRTPMNGVVGFAEFLKDPYLGFELRKKYADIVISSSKQLLVVVNDILDISRIESNTLYINSETVNIHELIQETTDFFAPQIQEKNLQLRISHGLKNTEASIISDKTRIKQIVLNLMSNAIKFTDSGSIEVGYVLENKHIVFFVKDTGIGIPQKYQSAIFERFQQITDAQTKQYGGTGLGLAISYKIASLLGGTMWVESTEGEGSTFYFTIPYTFTETKTATKDTQIATQDEHTVLVAEDDDINFLYIQTLLAFAHIHVIRAHTGKEAVELFLKNPTIQLIFMDIKMPVMDGFEASKEILRHNKNVSIVILSAFDLNAERAIAEDIGCYDYIAKPIKKDKIIEILSTFSLL